MKGKVFIALAIVSLICALLIGFIAGYFVFQYQLKSGLYTKPVIGESSPISRPIDSLATATDYPVTENLIKAYCSSERKYLSRFNISNKKCLESYKYDGYMGDIDDDGKNEYMIKIEIVDESYACAFLDDESQGFRVIDGTEGACKFEILPEANHSFHDLVVNPLEYGEESGDLYRMLCTVHWDGKKYVYDPAKCTVSCFGCGPLYPGEE